MKYLTLFTIGPVQSFIAKARKLQDLYAGSYLLSYLTKQTMRYAQNEKDATIIMPDCNQESAPNRFLMTVECEDKETLREICQSLDKYVRNIWEDIAKKVLDKVNLEYTDAVEKQVKSLLQVFYASEPYQGGENFGDCYLNVIKRLGAAKTIRSFVQLDEGYGRKCNLMYEYNALFHRDKNEVHRKTNYISPQAQVVTEKNISPTKRLDKYLQEDETLSAPAFIKRCLKFAIDDFNDEFPSVTDVYEMYNAKYNEDDDKHGYYAVVMFDGDDMGMWYSNPDIYDKSQIEQFQSYLSKKISEFAAKESRKVVNWENRENGTVVYAGGEDFLGVLNLGSVFQALKELRETFGQIDISSFTDKKLTFSAGVVIAHIKTPLNEVLTLARTAEQKAKKYDNKNAYCVMIAKHSGEVTEFTHPFYTGDISSIDILNRLVEILVGDKLSTKFIYQLGGIMEHVVSSTDAKEIYLLETERLLKHSDFPEPDKKKKVIAEVNGILKQLVDISDISNALGVLRAVAFIARERGAE